MVLINVVTFFILGVLIGIHQFFKTSDVPIEHVSKDTKVAIRSLDIDAGTCYRELITTFDDTSGNVTITKEDVSKLLADILPICSLQFHKSLADDLVNSSDLINAEGVPDLIVTAVSIALENKNKQTECEKVQNVVKAICPLEFNNAFRIIPETPNPDE